MTACLSLTLWVVCSQVMDSHAYKVRAWTMLALSLHCLSQLQGSLTEPKRTTIYSQSLPTLPDLVTVCEKPLVIIRLISYSHIVARPFAFVPPKPISHPALSAIYCGCMPEASQFDGSKALDYDRASFSANLSIHHPERSIAPAMLQTGSLEVSAPHSDIRASPRTHPTSYFLLQNMRLAPKLC